ncbi:TRAP transporter large permease subunit [Paracoccus sediminis]|uniref:TRAP transporter large permease protein n=1 Tax=Paracoccus sediminis TaxID=1214787 RepID=A0A238WMU2_9RHOB|nr:TRAP transporter large permease subunit [Paracoccus sediminis]TBN50481.1 TRAP transporter large permease subunit [Paracoccus sediminis]SNR47574.1 TRAP transporter, DctM subunit [Paracoccus sediminis]
MTLALVLSFTVLMLLAVPVGHALVLASAFAIYFFAGLPLSIVVQQLYQQTQSFPMLALPFFMLAGTLMLGGTLGNELLAFASKVMQRWKGGPLATTVVASVVFGGVSGSAVANASALGSVLIPWQKRQGYPAALCSANNSTSAVIDILIPPSIPLILYSLVSGTSIADLFTAGLLPGVLLAVGLILCCNWIARRRGFTATDNSATLRELARLALLSSPALLLPVLILLGLRFGIATPTEISVLAVVYALGMSVFLYRDITWARFQDNLIEAGVATGVVMLVIMGSAAVGWILTFDQVPTRFAAWITETVENPILIILSMNLLLLVIGMPLDLPPAILLLGPIFVPLAASIGMDPVQLGLMMVLNLGIGLYTPPIGTTLFISASIAKTTLGATTRELWPFFLVSMIVLALVSYVPALTLY